MTGISNKNLRPKDPIVNVMLNGGRVTSSFRDNLFDAANRAGMTPNEFVLQAAAEKLASSGRAVTGLFHRGDLPSNELTGRVC